MLFPHPDILELKNAIVNHNVTPLLVTRCPNLIASTAQMLVSSCVNCAPKLNSPHLGSHHDTGACTGWEGLKLLFSSS